MTALADDKQYADVVAWLKRYGYEDSRVPNRTASCAFVSELILAYLTEKSHATSIPTRKQELGAQLCSSCHIRPEWLDGLCSKCRQR